MEAEPASPPEEKPVGQRNSRPSSKSEAFLDSMPHFFLALFESLPMPATIDLSLNGQKPALSLPARPDPNPV